jgi:phosphoglycolate phosphatase-like HAD superfamily hydrolase
MAPARARVVLFDLDGTVLTFEGPSPGPGKTALDLAMRDLYGKERATDGLRIAGGTDRALVRAMLERGGVAVDAAALTRVLDAYLARLEEILRTRRYRPIGEVARSVEVLRARGAVVGVATGNARRGAALKLASAGLGDSFDLRLGAYGCEVEPRAEIVRLAAERCGARDGVVEVVVVGDTDHDVMAGRAVGARVVGVAMPGSATARAELEAAGADVIVDGCSDALVDAVLS